MKLFFKKIIILLLLAALLTISMSSAKSPVVSAAEKYITITDFALEIAEVIELTTVSGLESSGYVNALVEKGIIKDGDFTSYTKYLTRGDAALLLNRADEYLYGDTLDAELVELALDKRISDIGKIKASKRMDVAKAYLKGFIKGYSNGEYSTDRTLKVNSKIMKTGALDCIKMLKNKVLRAKISPDGQLIRTTKLPKYARYYPYILASYPNTYYDWKFDFEGQSSYNPRTGIRTPYENIKDYAAPVDVDKTTEFDDFASVKNEYLDIWVGKVRTYMETVFSADYRTINDKWVETILSTDYSYENDIVDEQTKEEIEQYVANMKKNKTIVEYSKVAVEGSSLYFFDGSYYLRTYVKYRIVSSNIKYGVDTDTKIAEKPYNNILYTSFPLVDFTGFKLGIWKEGHFDIELSSYSEENGGNLGIFYAYLNEYFYAERRTDQ